MGWSVRGTRNCRAVWWELPQNEGSPRIPSQAGYRSKEQGVLHAWFHAVL
jgi:hypothetical protein